MKKNILVAGITHESHSFLAKQTKRKDFESRALLIGKDLLTSESIRGSTMDAFLTYAKTTDWKVIPSSLFTAMPSGKVDHQVVEEFLGILIKDLKNNLEIIDAVFFILHGAMVSSQCNDVEGLILSETQKVLFASNKKVPVFGVLDLHANVSQLMIENSSCLFAFRKNPHTDAYQTSFRLAKLLDKVLKQNLEPKQSMVQIPLILPPIYTGSDAPIMKNLLEEVELIEENDKDILCINIIPGFSYSDTKDTRFSISGTTTRDVSKLNFYLEKLAEKAWALRDSHIYKIQSPPEIIQSIKNLKLDGPIIITEPSDNVGGGAPGDGTEGLRALIESGLKGIVAVICDAEAVAFCFDSGLNTTISLSIGGKTDAFHGSPMMVSGKIINLSNGQFILEDKNSHLAAVTGENIEMGNCATLQTDQALILLTSLRMPQMDLGQLRTQKIIPENQFIILVKAAVAHKQAYDPIAKHSFAMETKGLCSTDLSLLPFQNLSRPIYPIDKNFQFNNCEHKLK